MQKHAQKPPSKICSVSRALSVNMNSYSELLDYIVSLDSKYQEVWESEENYNRNDNGDSAMCGVLAEFGQYLQDHQTLMALPYLESLFQFIETEADSQTELGCSIRVCFLENLSYTEAGKSLEKYMGKRTFHYYNGGTFPWNT